MSPTTGVVVTGGGLGIGSVGRAHPHVEVRIADPETGDTVLRSQAGEFMTPGLFGDAGGLAAAIKAV